MRPRRAQFRGEKLPAYNAPSDDWGLVCARSRLDPIFGLCVCEVRTPRPMGARHTWGRDVRVASPVIGTILANMSASPNSASRLGTKLEIHQGVTATQSNAGAWPTLK